MPECYNFLRLPGVDVFSPDLREGITMMFLGITALYVAGAVAFYGYLVATAVDESDLPTLSHRRWRRAHAFQPVRHHRAGQTVLSRWQPAPRPVHVRVSASRRLDRRLDWRCR